MPDGNGERGWREEMQARLAALEQAHRELEDSFIVMTHLETRMSRVMREQSEYLASHETRLRQAEQRNQEVDQRIEKLVSAIGALLPNRAQ